MIQINKRFSILLLFLLIAAGGIWLFNEWNTSAQENKTNSAAIVETGVTTGKKMPQFNLASLSKKEVVVKNLDKPIILNFFATWCPPCREEMPDLDLFLKKHKNDVDFYAINIQESPIEVLNFMDKNGYSFKEEVLLDLDGKIAENFRINSIPTTIITDKDGVIRYRKTGLVTLAELENILGQL